MNLPDAATQPNAIARVAIERCIRWDKSVAAGYRHDAQKCLESDSSVIRLRAQTMQDRASSLDAAVEELEQALKFFSD